MTHHIGQFRFFIEALRERRPAGADEEATVPESCRAFISKEEVRPLEESLDRFWQGCCGTGSFEVDPRKPEVENAVLKRLGDSPFYIGKDNLASLLSKAYGIASEAALKKAEGNGEQT